MNSFFFWLSNLNNANLCLFEESGQQAVVAVAATTVAVPEVVKAREVATMAIAAATKIAAIEGGTKTLR